ncbi:hypothetical protein [Microbulbifer sp. SAOS-129_SWC]|uniref:hypothetical protein n=1 Tax=Microbulbifer sp. SAOS-129_SWC TaxID=3145235 RepID=UPI003217D14F
MEDRKPFSLAALVFVFAPLAILFALLFFLVYQNLDYVINGERLDTVVTGKSERQVDSRPRESKPATALYLHFRYPSPRFTGYFETASELAPLIYWLYDEGDEIGVYYQLNQSPQVVIAAPLQFWRMPLLALFFLVLYLPVGINCWHRGGRSRELKFALAVTVAGLAFYSVSEFTAHRALQEQMAVEKQAEQYWRHWPAFESANPKPPWWHSVPLGRYNPLQGNLQPYYSFNERMYQGKPEHPGMIRYKVAYAKMLELQDDPAAMIGWLCQGRYAEMLPLYEFYFQQFYTTDWEVDCDYDCSNESTITGLAADIAALRLDLGDIDRAQQVLDRVYHDKYSGASPYSQYQWLYEQTRLLMNTRGTSAARARIDQDRHALMQRLQQLGLKKHLKKTRDLFRFPFRPLGIHGDGPVRYRAEPPAADSA